MIYFSVIIFFNKIYYIKNIKQTQIKPIKMFCWWSLQEQNLYFTVIFFFVKIVISKYF